MIPGVAFHMGTGAAVVLCAMLSSKVHAFAPLPTSPPGGTFRCRTVLSMGSSKWDNLIDEDDEVSLDCGMMLGMLPVLNIRKFFDSRLALLPLLT